MPKQTKGSIESEVANAVVRFQREQQGRGPKEVRAHLAAEMIVVRSAGIFTATEERLSVSEEGRSLIKSSRRELRQISKNQIEQEVATAVGVQILRSFYDVDVDSAEQVEVYVFSEDLEKRLLQQELAAYSAASPRRI